MNIILVTGMSGAGKSVALKTLEDAGYEAIDNMPLSLLPVVASGTQLLRPLAVGADIRSRDFSVSQFLHALAPLRNNPNISLKIIYLDCDDEVLKRRYTETRRKHPLALDRPIEDGLRLERSMIEKLRDVADLVIDTTDTLALDLRRLISSHFAGEAGTLTVNITSFSFKRGLPREADMVFDVRFFRNPHYDSALRELTGADAPVGDFIRQDPAFAPFIEQTTGLLSTLLPRFREEGKSYLTIGIGCTGGRHRSVYVARTLAETFRARGYNITIRHRDTEIAE